MNEQQIDIAYVEMAAGIRPCEIQGFKDACPEFFAKSKGPNPETGGSVVTEPDVQHGADALQPDIDCSILSAVSTGGKLRQLQGSFDESAKGFKAVDWIVQNRTDVSPELRLFRDLCKVYHDVGLRDLSLRRQFAGNSSTVGWHVDYAPDHYKLPVSEMFRAISAFGVDTATLVGLKSSAGGIEELCRIETPSGKVRLLSNWVRDCSQECRDLFGKLLQHRGERATRDIYSVFCKAPASKNVPAMFAKGLELA